MRSSVRGRVRLAKLVLAVAVGLHHVDHPDRLVLRATLEAMDNPAQADPLDLPVNPCRDLLFRNPHASTPVHLHQTASPDRLDHPDLMGIQESQANLHQEAERDRRDLLDLPDTLERQENRVLPDNPVILEKFALVQPNKVLPDHLVRLDTPANLADLGNLENPDTPEGRDRPAMLDHLESQESPEARVDPDSPVAKVVTEHATIVRRRAPLRDTDEEFGGKSVKNGKNQLLWVKWMETIWHKEFIHQFL